MARILIVDDDRGFRESLAETVASLGHRPTEAEGGRQGIAALREGDFDLVLLDYRMPGMNGIDVLREISADQTLTKIPVVMLTAYASGDDTIEAIKLGAFDHLTKPIGRADLDGILGKALRTVADSHTANSATTGPDLIGASPAMREVLKLIGRVASSDATVLITGETGTGKELIARALHRHSSRSLRQFVAINCAAIPRDLLESELFGHVKGAFTGATKNRTGIFQQADGGTLLLDEVGDMSLELQAKILRVLEERVVLPVGANHAERVDVRLVAATHRDLARNIAQRTFREDLYYRLNVIHIHIPPLRDRFEDIVPLAEHFLAQIGEPSKALTEAAKEQLRTHAWPGNVRELRNIIERAALLARGTTIDLDELALTSLPPAAGARIDAGLPAAIAQLEESAIRRALLETGGNRAEAARRLGVRRQFLYDKIKQYSIEKK